MSFIEDIIKFGNNAEKAFNQFNQTVNFFNNLGSAFGQSSNLLQIAESVKANIMSPISNVTNALNNSLSTQTVEEKTERTTEVRLEYDPNPENAIPVVYGTGYLTGKLIDAQLTNNNCTMWYALVLCETTGTVQSTGQPSTIYIDRAYWQGNRLDFLASDRVTVAAAYATASRTVKTDIIGNVKIYAYNNGSNSPTPIPGQGYAAFHGPAWDYMPGWTTNHTMDGLVFVLIRVDYDKASEITGIGNIKFKVRNTMRLPGDVMYDYMTNSRYGAGIEPTEIDL